MSLPPAATLLEVPSASLVSGSGPSPWQGGNSVGFEVPSNPKHPVSVH